MGPNPVIPCAYKKGKFGYSLRQKEGHLASPGKTEATRNPGEAWNGFSSQPLGRTHPVTSFFADSQAGNCETVHSCCFKPPSFWYFATAAPGNEYSSDPLKGTEL